MQLTRRGVCYDLMKTPYRYEEEYHGTKIQFMFSSQINTDKFIDKLEQNRKRINESLLKRFKFHIKQDIICDIRLYQTIETRGFLICANGEYIECLDHIQLNGVEVTKKNLDE